MNFESRITRLEQVTPATLNPVYAWPDERVEREALEIIRRTTGYTGTLSGPAGSQVAHLILKCGGNLDLLDRVNRGRLNILLGGGA